MRELTIDPEFAALLPPLSAAEHAHLREGLESDRVCHAPMIEWANHGILIDGHHRYPLCRELKIPFEIVSLPFADRLDIKQWIIRTQAGRRNISPDQLALLLGEEYEREKVAVPNPEGRNQHSEVSGHADHQPKAAERIAARNGVSEATVRRAARTYKAARTVADNTGSTPAKVVAKVGRAKVEEIADLPVQVQGQALEHQDLGTVQVVEEPEPVSPVITIGGSTKRAKKEKPVDGRIREMRKNLERLSGAANHAALTAEWIQSAVYIAGAYLDRAKRRGVDRERQLEWLNRTRKAATFLVGQLDEYAANLNEAPQPHGDER